MRIVLVYKRSSLALTIPKKWVRGKVKRIIDSYCSSPTGKRLGLSENWDDVYLETDGRAIGQEEVIHGSLRDGDVVHVRRRREEETVVKKEERPTRVRSAVAKQLTKKAEDFASAHDDCEWRGVRFGCYLVCDGHGGQAAAQSAKQKLLPNLLEALDRRVTPPPGVKPTAALARELPGAIVDAFEATDRGALATGAGTTATMVVVLPGIVAADAAGTPLMVVDSDDEEPDDDEARSGSTELAALAADAALVVCANVGDSLAYVDHRSGGKSVRLLSHDHRLERNATEQQRCRTAGSRVARDAPGSSRPKNDDDDDAAAAAAAVVKKPLRLWPGGLMFSRALGDADAPHAVPTPELRACLVFDGAARIVLASDGLWDELSGRAALKLIAPKRQPSAAAQTLVSEARKRGTRRNDTDDIIVVVVDVDAGNNAEGENARAPLLRLWEIVPEQSGLLAGGSLNAAIRDARRRRVAEVSRSASTMPAGKKQKASSSSSSLEWLGLAADPADFFEPKRVIGTGGFGSKVLLCAHRMTGASVAIKVMTKAALRRKRHEKRVRVERDSLLALSGGGSSIAALFCAWQTERAVCLAMPYVGGGDLGAALAADGRLLEPNAAFYGAQVVCALEFAHARGVLHRDVKPENVLLDAAGHAVLIDLGLARPVPLGPDDLARTRCGTDEYWSPEMVRKQRYSTATDVWSAVLLVYELLAGKSPFLPDRGAVAAAKKKKKPPAVKDLSRIHEAILAKPLEFSPPEAFSAASVDLLRRALDRDPEKRLGVARDGVSADLDSLRAHSWWRSARDDGRHDQESWWRAMDARRIPPPDPPESLVRARRRDDDGVVVGVQENSAALLREARSYLHPPQTHDDLGDAEASEDSALDPYDGFDHGSPADHVWSLQPPRRSADGPAESEMAPRHGAVPETAVLKAHALARRFLARGLASKRRRAAALLSRAARDAIVRRALAKIARLLPKLRRALRAAGRSAKRRVFHAWVRFSARVASARAADDRRRRAEEEDRYEVVAAKPADPPRPAAKQKGRRKPAGEGSETNDELVPPPSSKALHKPRVPKQLHQQQEQPKLQHPPPGLPPKQQQQQQVPDEARRNDDSRRPPPPPPPRYGARGRGQRGRGGRGGRWSSSPKLEEEEEEEDQARRTKGGPKNKKRYEAEESVDRQRVKPSKAVTIAEENAAADHHRVHPKPPSGEQRRPPKAAAPAAASAAADQEKVPQEKSVDPKPCRTNEGNRSKNNQGRPKAPPSEPLKNHNNEVNARDVPPKKPSGTEPGRGRGRGRGRFSYRGRGGSGRHSKPAADTPA
ncbi:hypothetical protein CTAYLR_002810 [Chrysophaeum taylorii]|uniref:Uncharacterized protein n=1 Tax=Chrysophaeum taylorii TaxID=2483200 RepID=A0AAD7XIU1_9STRA|nr:hypothetical protein CTAYLR_002810 [Chrysophaeum taylorii]